MAVPGAQLRTHLFIQRKNKSFPKYRQSLHCLGSLNKRETKMPGTLFGLLCLDKT